MTSERRRMLLRDPNMGEVLASMAVRNMADGSQCIECIGLIDTGASHLVLPMAWRDRLGELEVMEEVEVELADSKTVPGVVCGPVRVEVELFRPAFCPVLFMEMEARDGRYRPLIGHHVLQQAGIGVDTVRHELFRAPIRVRRAS